MEAEQMTPATVSTTPFVMPPPTDVERLDAEVATELQREEEQTGQREPGQPEPPAQGEEPVQYPPGVLALPLGEGDTQRVVHLLPPEEWTSGAQSALRTGDFDGWAERVLAHQHDLDVWMDFNDGDGPKIREINALFDELDKATGQDAGKSRTSRRSLRSGRRR